MFSRLPTDRQTDKLFTPPPPNSLNPLNPPCTSGLPPAHPTGPEQGFPRDQGRSFPYTTRPGDNITEGRGGGLVAGTLSPARWGDSTLRLKLTAVPFVLFVRGVKL
ncbi:hypothetical protein J6590_078618 [Homalodisca vitripennis]|nr:hypothetical protein J6590_078618 [Homalodisca vitripennis]